MKVSTLLGLLPGTALASDALSVAFYAKEKSQLYDFISANSEIDYGCRPVVMAAGDEHKLHAVIPENHLHHFKRSLNPDLVRVEILHNLNKRQTATAPIGKGDRFNGGKVAPRGLGTRKPSEYAQIQSAGVFNADEVYTAMKGLEKEYGMPIFTTPYKTFENNTIIGGVANKAEKINKDKQYIYFTSGIHARERGGPDNLIYFISDLLYANEHRIGLTYGNKTFTNSQVKKVLGAGIVFIPMLNPDGVRHDQANSNLWRKNRNPASSTPGVPLSVGVDLNRNFDFLWNFTSKFDPSVAPASTNPSSQAFYGTAPFSEPETRDMAWVYDEYPNIHWYIDVHSAAGTLLYSWGDDIDQSADPSQNLFNTAYDGKRGLIEDTLYQEYIDQVDWDNVALAANRTTAAMNGVGGREYVPQQAVGLYPTSGASDDWSFSRWHADKGVNKVYGYTMEFGYPTNFYPTSEEYVQNILDTNAGFMEFVLTAVEIGLKA
ncbi:zinc carboxypeptidase A 1 precursor [Pyrenophora tritici-repentis]|nr:zinc carboxypeptidase A 1 precursor [Pyrenophora tritici-repentis Pt-1C-BFP]KAA8626012.1 Zinc carboxypeptidase A 1 [Pyrenophora tritici-repentis]EDU40800.1 zinc carboxypeptidase A 1 precursor [Pyrenophora tritici-repentis Pt-1C-BFP]KAF7454425.1 Zinc carboxypeptidase A 1 [Pyrenophora tritici-repentis]KAF7577545.1 zinc carboxypeptidase A 1 precursor [Pyrenophora tritici-repentis]KAG9388171.1 Zinc carboxypeptidase A 1 [Pyrenophora tritici-repentis]